MVGAQVLLGSTVAGVLSGGNVSAERPGGLL